MMFPKPEHKIIEKKPYNSLQNRNNKQKKEIAPWRQDILSHHGSKPSTKDRGEFPRKVVAELIAETGGLCQCGCGRSATSTHHVMPRGRSGRGVKTNAMRTADLCHDRIQTNEEELQYWINVHREKYGDRFWFDEQDWEEYNRKQAAICRSEEEKRQRMEQLNPIVNLLSTAAGRPLKVNEIRMLDGLEASEITVFARLMKDVVGANVAY